MQNIEKYLINLMYQHECVVIPNFGGLVANHTPGFADSKNQLLHPPKKGFVWNKFLQHNDGLLAHEICKEEGISYDDAMAQLKSLVEGFKKQLQKDKRLEFKTIGSFFVDDENTVRFNPKKESYLISSFGLPIVKSIALPKIIETVTDVKDTVQVVQLNSIEGKKVESEKKPLGKIVEIKENERKSSNSKWWVAAALIPIGFYSAWIPMKTDLLKENGNFQYSDLNPFSFSKSIGIYETFEINFSKLDSLPIIDFSVLNLDNQTDLVDKGVSSEEPESTYVDVVVPTVTYTPSNSETGYFVIGGCFADKENADVFIKDLQSKGYDAQLVDFHQGLHRVAFGKYNSRDEAKTAKSDITNSGEFSAWVLKK